MVWSLHPASPTDHARVLPLVRAYHEFEGIALDESVRAAALARLLGETALGGIWLVLRDAEVAGYIALCTGFSLEFGGHDAFIDELYLKPEYRGQGGGRHALEMIKPAAAARSIRALHLEVARDNARARHLYGRCGFAARDRYLLMTTCLESCGT